MNYTQNYQLPQWESEDRILMEDFNDAMEKIEGGLSGLEAGTPKVAAGTYTGTGTSGSENPTSLTFPFRPTLVLVTEPTHQSVNLMLLPSALGTLDSPASLFTVNGADIVAAWEGNTVYWWSWKDDISQFNGLGKTYSYLAI